MKLLCSLALGAALAVSAWAPPASADVAPNPCMGGTQGDPCTDLHGRQGLCEPSASCSSSPSMCLVCVSDFMTSTSSSSSGGKGGSKGHGGDKGQGGKGGRAASSSSSQAPGAGGSSPVIAAPAASDSGCALAPGGAPSRLPVSVWLSILATTLVLSCRRRGAARAPG